MRIRWPNASVLVLVLCLLATYTAWSLACRGVRDRSYVKFERAIGEVSMIFKDRLNEYLEALYSVRAFFAASKQVDREEWRAFADQQGTRARFPGITSIRYVQRVTSRNKDRFIQSAIFADVNSLDRAPEFRIFPVGDRQEYYVIKYADPIVANAPLRGLDVLSLSEWRQAFIAAKDTGEPSMVWDFHPSHLPLEYSKGLAMMILPIYYSKMPVSTKEERAEALEGFATITFRIEDMIRNVIGNQKVLDDISFDVFSGVSPGASDGLYADSRYATAFRMGYRPLFSEERVLKVADKSWTLRFVTLPGFQAGPLLRKFPLFVLFSGVLISLLLFGLINALDSARLQAVVLAKKMTSDLRLEAAERKCAEEEAKKALNIKSEFCSMVSHELRTPLTVMKECLAIVEDGSAGPVTVEQKDYLDTAVVNLQRLSCLVDDVLDFQKLESSRMQLDLKKTDINVLIGAATKAVEIVAKTKSLHIATEFAKNLPPVVLDKDKITQVLLNLLDNAVKFSLRGSILVRSELQGDVVRVSVIDEGRGIHKEDVHKLFQSFSQLPSEDNGKEPGTGLGLAICKKVIEGHGGRIGVESVYGKGSTFYFTLPVR